MKKTFNVGDRVATFLTETEDFTTKPPPPNTDYSEPECGEVVEVLTNGQLRVNFDSKYLNERTYSPKNGQPVDYTPALVDAKLLFSETEAKEKCSILEKEYKVVSKQVQEKMKEAAKIIRDAQKLAKKELGTNLADMYDAYDALYSAMDASGWRTSSFGC
jgi:hypothetical protein